MNRLYFGDNLAVLRESIASETVDLIYLDPPFNSNADYNILYGTKRGGPSQAQTHAFEDTWKWGIDAKRAIDETAARHLEAGSLLDSFQKIFPESNMMAYLAMMAVRLVELHRVLKSTGSLYLHCDSTASHYLKVLLDAIFGPKSFRNEIIWERFGSHNDPKRFGRVTDTILFYSKSDVFKFNPVRVAYSDAHLSKRFRYSDPDGRKFWPNTMLAPGGRGPRYEWNGHTRNWRFTKENMEQLEAKGEIYYSAKGMPYRKNYLDALKGQPVQNLWTDIKMTKSGAEKLPYPTQKPLALLERIILASSDKGNMVLDPFCGCGTAIEAAEKNGRNWIGIDITYLAIHVIESRLVKAFGTKIKDAYELIGRPKDADDARALAARDWLEFQKWAVMQLGGLPKDRPGPDGGIDGIIRYHRVGIEQPNRAVVSVKGGTNIGVDAIHKLKSVVQRENAELGVLVCIDRPTQAMVKEAASLGEVGPRSRRVQKIQIITVDMLFRDDAVRLPGVVDLPEAIPAAMVKGQVPKARKKDKAQTEMLFPISDDAAESVPKRKANRSFRDVDVEVVRPWFGGKSK